MANRFLNNISINDQYTLPASDGSANQVLATNGSGQLSFVDQTGGTSETAERIEVTVKNVSGGSLSKGTVVHASPSATPPSGNVIEVIAADYDDSTKMPAIGILNETIANEGEGSAVMMGAVSGIDTSSFSIGDELYVGNLGTLTNTKPATAGQLIQKIAVVIKSHASNGLIKIFGAGRSNDVPLPLYIDNTNQRVGIGESSPATTLHVNGRAVIGSSNTIGSSYVTNTTIIGSNNDTANTGVTTSTSVILGDGNGGRYGNVVISERTLKLGTDDNVANSSSNSTAIIDINNNWQAAYAYSNVRGFLGYFTPPTTSNDIYWFYTNDNNSLTSSSFGAGNTPEAAVMQISFSPNFGTNTAGNSSNTTSMYFAGNASSSGAVYITASNQNTSSRGVVTIDGRYQNQNYEIPDGQKIFEVTSGYGRTKFVVESGGQNNEASIGIQKDVFHLGDTDTFFGFTGADTFGVTTANSERMRIDSAGAVSVYNDFTINNGSPEIYFLTGATHYRWMIAAQENKDAALEITPSTAIGGSTYSTPVATFMATGNVGIGTTTPTARLHVSGTGTGAAIDWSNTTSSTGRNFRWVSLNSGGFAIEDLTAGGANRLTVGSTGNVGIGTTSPGYKLDVQGQIRLKNPNHQVVFHDTDSGVDEWSITTYSNTGLSFYDGATTGSPVMTLLSGGNVGIAMTNPGYKLDISGTGRASSSLRAPIFYDSSNSNFNWDPGTDNSHRFTTASGYIDIGPKNTSWCHIYTDRNGFYFNKTTFQLNGNQVFHDGYHPNADAWTTGRTITIGNTGKTVDGSGNVSWSLAEIGAQAAGSYAAAGDENIIDGATSIWNADGDGDVFVYDDNNPTHNGKNVGAVIDIKGDGVELSSLIRAGIYTGDHVSVSRGYYVGTVLDTTNTNTTQVINSSGYWSSYPVFPYDSFSKTDISTRTETGFYQDSSPTSGEGWPALGGNTSWAHLISCTHSNDSNYYAMQLSASFYNQNLYYRSTAGSGTTGWSKMWSDQNDGAGSGLDADLLDGQQGAAYFRNNYTSGGDLNTDSASGIYRFQTTESNRPGGITYGTLVTFNNNSDTGFQLVGDYHNTGLYWRGGNSSTFGGSGTNTSWFKIWHDGNDGSGSGLDADTVDGIQGGSFLRSDANDSFTGDELHFPTLDLSISNNNSQNNGNTYFRGTGTHFVLGLNNGNTCYLNYGNSSGALRLYGSSIYWNDSNIGSPWGSANDGSGSGLDADLLDGAQGSSYLRSDTSDTFNAGNGGLFTVEGVFKVANPSATSQAITISNASSGGETYIANGNGNTIFFGVPSNNTTNIEVQGVAMAAAYRGRFNTSYYTDHEDTGDSIRVAGDIVAFYSSDKRYKENIKPIESPIEKVKAISGVTFEWNEKSHKKTGKKDIGVIAQEIEEVLPEIVQTRDNGYKAVDYQKLTAVLIEAVKDQQKQIDELKSIINGGS